jgi:transposase
MAAEPTDDSSEPKAQGKLTAQDRKSIIERLESGETQVALAQEFGVTRQYVSLLLKKFRQDGEGAIVGGRRGRKPSRLLTPDEEKAIHRIIKKHQTPKSAGLPVGRKKVERTWGLDTVKKLIVRELSFTPKRSTVLELLQKWGITISPSAEDDEMEFSQSYYDYINSPIGREVSRKSREMRDRQLAERAAEAAAAAAAGEGLGYSDEELAKIRRKMLAGRPMGGGGRVPGQRVGKHRKAKTPAKRKKRKKKRRK